MNLRPLHDRVIVKRLDQETKTASGIVIPEAAAEKPDQGEILAVGPGKRDDKGAQIALDVKVGDRVLFGKYASWPWCRSKRKALLNPVITQEFKELEDGS
jgi:chaperonin GroES